MRGDRLGAFFGVLQEVLQMPYALGLGTVGIELVGFERCVHAQLLPSARHRDVQPAFTAITVEGAKVQRDFTRRISAERDGEEHHVAFISLHILQVLDHRRLDPLVSEIPLEFGCVALRLVQ